MQSSLG